MGRAYYAETLARAARKPLWASIFIIMLDIGMMVVAIMAYTGAQSADDSATIQDTYITFPDAGDNIQRLEIALVSYLAIRSGTVLIMVMNSLL